MFTPLCLPAIPKDSANWLAAWQPRMYPQLNHHGYPSGVAVDLPDKRAWLTKYIYLGVPKGVHGPLGGTGVGAGG